MNLDMFLVQPQKGDPSNWVETSMTGDGSDNMIGIAVDSLREGEEEGIVSAIREMLQGGVILPSFLPIAP